jgi:hypothetical protein
MLNPDFQAVKKKNLIILKGIGGPLLCKIEPVAGV